MDILDPDFDEKSFEAAYAVAAERAAVAAGFPTPLSINHPVDEHVRMTRLRHKAHGANELVTDIQQWLVDDNREVREVARRAVTALLRSLYTGDENDTSPTTPESGRLAKIATKVLTRPTRPDFDARQPWWCESVWQRRLRWVLNSTVLLLGFGTAVAVATAQPALGLVGLVLTVAVDLAESAYTSSVRNRNADQRWVACVFRQVSDTFMLTGIAIALALMTRPFVAAVVVTAILVSVTGSFIRVSALQAGHRIWLSGWVRLTRWLAVACYCIDLLAFGNEARSALIAALLLGFTGCWEAFNTVWRVVRSSASRCPNVVVLDPDDHVEMFPIPTPQDGMHAVGLTGGS